ncbi:carboxypeptidase M32 [Haploplasma modicum]|jgi:carboxypeptidase Taq|uniref:carboxypeptidase M32 n=1 Tax=Haploplasma modicum TaxID=2150 RepID=UPI00214C82A5|nr:carboxypeptidase M32 [Haploplasma modicum]MCR1809035.1 carboxypeptidase M32 [Haploplasma modicum]
MDEIIKEYKEHRKKIIAFRYVDWLINWDQKTQAPKKSGKFRAEQVEVLSEMYFDLRKDSKFLNNIDYLKENLNKINDEDLKKDILKIDKELRVIRSVPINEYIDYQVVLAESTKVWQEARDQNDFEIFVPALEKIVDYHKRRIKYIGSSDLQGYDVLLDEYEEGKDTKFYDDFFNNLKEELVPFVALITKGKKTNYNRKLTTREYPIYKQKEISKYFIDQFAFDLKRGAIRDTVHPFTSGISSTDIRITVDYEINNFTTSITSIMHEMGHAIYDQNNDPKYNGTFLFGSPTYGLHEAQARFYENMIGRSFAFWKRHYPKLEEVFPKQLAGINSLEYYRFINHAKRSKIRTEADELTYPLHIMVRYEIEKELFEDKLKVRDIPKRWRTLMANYVGVRPKDDLEGPLQDIHWALGSFGYFPVYALANAYAVQIYNAMNRDLNVESVIENENIYLINDWLKVKINRFGASKSAEELLIEATGEAFNPKYYIDYLKNKFTMLKNLEDLKK